MVKISKIKILYLVSALKECGPITVLYNIISGLDQEKFDVFLLALSKSKTDQTKEKFNSLNIKIIELNQTRFKGFLVNQRRVQELIVKRDIDLVHSHGFRADMINAKLKGAISLNTIHNFPQEDYQHRYGKIKGAILAAKHINLIRAIQVPISCSETIMKKIKDKYHIDTNYIQNGIDLDLYSPAQLDKTSLKQTLNLPRNQNAFIVSGALTKLKNPENIIKAFNLLPQMNYILICIGSGDLYESLSKAYQSEKVKFFGHVDHVNNYLASSEVYVSASLTEGFPNSVLEAIGMGLPVMLSNIPVHREIVGDNYPYLFDPMNPSELAEKMNEIIAPNNINRCKTFSLELRNQFSSMRMSKKYAERYIESYSQVNDIV